VTVEVSTLDGDRTVSHQVQAHAGINRWFWNLRFEAPAGQLPQGFRGQGRARGSEAEAGSYLVRITANGRTVEGILAVRDDPGVEGVLPSVR
jgi:hypothetical protein